MRATIACGRGAFEGKLGRHIEGSVRLFGHSTVRLLAVVNISPRQIGKLPLECLILAAPVGDGDLALLAPEKEVLLGAKIF